MDQELSSLLETVLRDERGERFSSVSLEPQSGGCINEAYLASDGARSYFVKFNSSECLPMFEAEAAALGEIAATQTIRVPEPVAHGTSGRRSYLVLEALPFGAAKPKSWEQMGQQLAALHQSTAERFGWKRDNTIGPTPQRNEPATDWATFFREQRLRPQLEIARGNGLPFERADALLEQIDSLLEGHRPVASLLHGDLWSGNADFLEDGTPVIYDPASYYGDREADLAFSEFFGGFHRDFYRAYEAAWPLKPGYSKRKQLYNLYHVINHANLFGGSYTQQAQSMIGALLAAPSTD
jgi:fructosamine-3-kinase